MKTNKEKKQLLQNLLCDTLDALEGFPKPLKMLGKSAAKAIDENKIDSILDGTLDFLADAYAKVEAIKIETPVIQIGDYRNESIARDEPEAVTELLDQKARTGTDDV